MWKFKKKKSEKEVTELTTLEQVRKAYEDLSDDDKKSFHQSIADRVHESIAAQERADGNEDSQSAEDREHEALGEEHAEGHGDVEELHSEDKPEGAEKEPENKGSDEGDFQAEMRAFMQSVSKYFKNLEKRAEEAADPDSEAAKRMEETYGIGQGIFQGDERSAPEKKLTKEEIAQQISKFM